MTKGKIVLTSFPFTDLSGSKRRPALIVSKENSREDVIVAFITSRLYKESETDLLINNEHPDFAKTGLKVPSLIRLSKLATLEKALIVGEIGYCGDNLLVQINSKLKLTCGL